MTTCRAGRRPSPPNWTPWPGCARAVSVNSVLGFAAVPALPFGGWRDSGFGRIHGEEGLRAFTSVRSMTVRLHPAGRADLLHRSGRRAERAVRLARALRLRR
ncbi:aldehyde dehydrogenase family protein [Streptomyces sp. M19]